MITLIAVKDGDSFKLVLDIKDSDISEYLDYANPSKEVILTKTEQEYLEKVIKFEKEPIREEEM